MIKSTDHINKDLKDKLSDEKGVGAIIFSSSHEYEKLPMLEIIFQKFAVEFSQKLRSYFHNNTEAKFISLRSVKFQEYFISLKKTYTIAIFQSVGGWESSNFLVIFNETIFSFLNVFFGGKSFISSKTIQEKLALRSLTTIEKRILLKIKDIILESLENVFRNLIPTHFIFKSLEENYKFLKISEFDTNLVLVKIEVKIDDKKNYIELVFPYKSIGVIRPQLKRIFLGEESSLLYNRQRKYVENAMKQIQLKLEVKILKENASLSEVADLKVGDTVIIGANKGWSNIYCQNIAISSGKLGKINGHVAVSII